MAQPQQFHPPYGSPLSSPSPMTPGANNGFAPPATKRPQMSPDTPTAPYQAMQSPPIPNGGHAGFNPYAQPNTNPYPLPGSAQAQQSQFRPPPHSQPSPQQQHPMQPSPQPQTQTQPTQAQGTMGPPQKPEDNRNADLNDLADVMHGSGVDLKAEEANLAMQARRTNYAHAGQPGHFDTQRNILQANVVGGRDSFYGSGTLNQSATTLQSAEEEAEAKQRLALRQQAERRQFHNNEPFLLQSVVVNKINACAQKTQTQVNMDGVYHPTPNTTNRLAIVGPDGSERIVTLTKEPLLSTASPMSDVLTLLSFAARERVRTAIEDSAAIVRGRRATAHGTVPPEFQDIALGQGRVKKATAEPLPLIGAGSPGANPRKRSHSQANELPTPVSETEGSPKPEAVQTIAFPDLLSSAMQRRLDQEAKWEEERVAKRARRKTEKYISQASGGSRPNSVAGTPAPGTPGPVDGVAPDSGKMTKKEQRKRQEAQAQAAAGKDQKASLSMALGGPKLSWMTGGKAGGGLGAGTSFGKKGSVGSVGKKNDKQNKGAPANAANAGAANTGKPKQLGGQREDGADGAGIQLRDIVSILKDKNPEKKTLSKAFSRMNTR